MAKQKGLGKGLGALLGEESLRADTPAEGAVSTLPLQKIEPNPLQPRKTFAEEELDLRKIAAQYADYILARPQRAVNENLLGELYRRAGEENWSVAQRRAVARTLACVVQEG